MDQKDDDSESDKLCVCMHLCLHVHTASASLSEQEGSLYGGEKPLHCLKQLDVADKV